MAAQPVLADAEGLPANPPPPPTQISGLAAAIAVEVCHLLDAEPAYANKIPMQPATTEANALQRLGALGAEAFSPRPELLTLPTEGVDILIEEWQLSSGGSAEQRHARLLLSPRAKGVDIEEAKNIGLPRRCKWPSTNK